MDSQDLFEGMEDWEETEEESSEAQAIPNKKLSEMTVEERQAFEQSKDYKEYAANFQDSVPIEGNLNGRSVREVLGLSNIKKTLSYSFNAIKCWITDIEDYEDMVAQSPVMQQTLEEGEQLLPTFKYLYQDLFLSLRKYRPEIVPEHEMHLSTRINRSILAELVNTPEFIQLRRSCRMDNFLSAWGAETLGKDAIKIIRDYLQKIKDLQQKKDALDDLIEKEEQIDDLVASNEELEEMVAELMRQAAAGVPGAAEQLAELQEQIAQNQQAIDQTKAMANAIAEQRCDDLIEITDDDLQEMTRVIGKSMDMASQEVQQVSSLCDAWGLGGGADCQINFQNKKTALEKIRRSSKLKQMTDMIGRFKESAITEQKKKAKDGAVELSSVTVGDKVQDILPSELMTLTHPSTKADFYRKLSEKQTMVYSKEAHKQKNKGPIIVCVDTSGSMSGDEEIWSKAMTVGVLEIAEMQKRDFACIIYSDHADEPIVIKKDEVSPDKIIQCAERFHGGGTDFESALEKAIKLIENSRFKEADIMFITDGDCGVSDKFLRRYRSIKADKGFKTQGILVNMGRGHCSDRTLKEFCDSITLVSDVAELKDSDSDVNKAIFGSL